MASDTTTTKKMTDEIAELAMRLSTIAVKQEKKQEELDKRDKALIITKDKNTFHNINIEWGSDFNGGFIEKSIIHNNLVFAIKNDLIFYVLVRQFDKMVIREELHHLKRWVHNDMETQRGHFTIRLIDGEYDTNHIHVYLVEKYIASTNSYAWAYDGFTTKGYSNSGLIKENVFLRG